MRERPHWTFWDIKKSNKQITEVTDGKKRERFGQNKYLHNGHFPNLIENLSNKFRKPQIRNKRENYTQKYDN